MFWSDREATASYAQESLSTSENGLAAEAVIAALAKNAQTAALSMVCLIE